MRDMLAASAILIAVYLGILAVAAVLLSLPSGILMPLGVVLFVGAVAWAGWEAQA